MAEVDFVILWVDGSDVNWLEEKKIYDKTITDVSSCSARFRDWGNLQYWFRGVERFAPWVNRIYFITWGHIPPWLNVNHPKLKIVNHRDYIPAEYLPTYNSNVIELNLHRIEDLSEHFVLFNDDTFILKEVEKADFFKHGKPRDEFVLNAIIPHYNMPIISHTCVNNVRIINRYFSKKQVIKKNFTKIFRPAYGMGLIETLFLMPWHSFPGFRNLHLPQAHLKSTFAILWEKEYEQLNQTSLNKFREYNDLNHWLMRYWNLCSGCFAPRSKNYGRMYNASDDTKKIVDYIMGQKGKVICINDMISEFNFEEVKKEINGAFKSILGEKSEFEI